MEGLLLTLLIRLDGESLGRRTQSDLVLGSNEAGVVVSWSEAADQTPGLVVPGIEIDTDVNLG